MDGRDYVLAKPHRHGWPDPGIEKHAFVLKQAPKGEERKKYE
jgi:hypothetical protein